MLFEPIAIISQSCLFPGVTSPEELWRLSCAKQDSCSLPDEKNWLIDPRYLMNNSLNYDPNHSWTLRGGYIKNFTFDPQGFALAAEELITLDPMVQWLLHTARQAIQQTQYSFQHIDKQKIGAIFANLSYPSHSLIKLALDTWLKQQKNSLWPTLFQEKHPNWANRFMSGLPVHILAQALQLQGPAYALDAACSSTIYAIKLACDLLQNQSVTMMLAGGVNGMDELMMHMGFSGLYALSSSGDCRPFDQAADGILTSNGCGVFILKRLCDAERDQDKILGVIRGIGLSNDGHSALLSPTVRGQTQAILQAYQSAELDIQQTSFVECHATATPLGDNVELQSLKSSFKTNKGLALGALKGNIGHALTASAAASITRVLVALEQRQLPPVRRLEQPIAELRDSDFYLPQELETWENPTGPLRAGVNAFGMGGTNAHIVIEAWEKNRLSHFTPSQNIKAEEPELAIIAIETLTPGCSSLADFSQHVFTNTSLIENAQAKITQIELPLKLRATPNDLKETLSQQLAILRTGLDAVKTIKKPIFNERTGIYIGMGCDAFTAFYPLRGMLEGLLRKQDIPFSQMWLDQALVKLSSPSKSARALGSMSNVISSRLAIEWNCHGPCFAVSSEELSGIRALEIACEALKRGEIDMAIVGAVDMSCEAVHKLAAKALLPEIKQIPGDAAVLMVLKRLPDAERDQETIYAIVEAPNEHSSYELTETSFSHLFGHAHAASGLLHVAIAAIASHYQLLPPAPGKNIPRPWIPADQQCHAKVSVTALGEQQSHVYLRAAKNTPRKTFFRQKVPQIYCYSGTGLLELNQALKNHQESNAGPLRLTIIAEDETSLQQRRQLAQKLLENNTKPSFSLPHQGIYFCEKPVGGKIAMVFATSNVFYPEMGIDLTLSFPKLMPQLHQRYHKAQQVIDLLYGQTNEINGFNYLQETWVSGYLSTLHYFISRDILGIKPEMVLGHSRGEFLALNALGIHRESIETNDQIVQANLFTEWLSGRYQLLRHCYPELKEEQIGWENWRVSYDVEQAKSIIEQQPYCHLTIINSDRDFVFSGIPEACKKVLEQMKPIAAAKLSMDFITHSPEVKAIAPMMEKIYSWETHPVDVQFYSCITGRPFTLSKEHIAQEMLAISSEQVDFPKLIRNAYQDGARIFIEHGPQSLCSRWIKEILGDQVYVASAYDQLGRSSLNQFYHLMAELLAAGVPLSYQREEFHV